VVPCDATLLKSTQKICIGYAYKCKQSEKQVTMKVCEEKRLDAVALEPETVDKHSSFQARDFMAVPCFVHSL
jgi:hypothetical protein